VSERVQSIRICDLGIHGGVEERSANGLTGGLWAERLTSHFGMAAVRAFEDTAAWQARFQIAIPACSGRADPSAARFHTPVFQDDGESRGARPAEGKSVLYYQKSWTHAWEQLAIRR